LKVSWSNTATETRKCYFSEHMQQASYSEIRGLGDIPRERGVPRGRERPPEHLRPALDRLLEALDFGQKRDLGVRVGCANVIHGEEIISTAKLM
jgi:hypothetical protein